MCAFTSILYQTSRFPNDAKPTFDIIAVASYMTPYSLGVMGNLMPFACDKGFISTELLRTIEPVRVKVDKDKSSVTVHGPSVLRDRNNDKNKRELYHFCAWVD